MAGMEKVAQPRVEQMLAVNALAAAIELHDATTPGHNARVAELAVAIGEEMGVDEEMLSVLARSGLLHDLGKLGISDRILHKPGPLDAKETATLDQHPNLGLEVLKAVGGLQEVKEAIWSHHERLDGSGYPRGLRAGAIGLPARILAVADSYDSLTSELPDWRQKKGTDAALELLQKEGAGKLDERVLQALSKVVAEGRGRHLEALAEMEFFVGERRVGSKNRRWAGVVERRLQLGGQGLKNARLGSGNRD